MSYAAGLQMLMKCQSTWAMYLTLSSIQFPSLYLIRNLSLVTTFYSLRNSTKDRGEFLI